MVERGHIYFSVSSVAKYKLDLGAQMVFPHFTFEHGTHCNNEVVERLDRYGLVQYTSEH